MLNVDKNIIDYEMDAKVTELFTKKFQEKIGNFGVIVNLFEEENRAHLTVVRSIDTTESPSLQDTGCLEGWAYGHIGRKTNFEKESEAKAAEKATLNYFNSRLNKILQGKKSPLEGRESLIFKCGTSSFSRGESGYQVHFRNTLGSTFLRDDSIPPDVISGIADYMGVKEKFVQLQEERKQRHAEVDKTLNKLTETLRESHILQKFERVYQVSLIHTRLYIVDDRSSFLDKDVEKKAIELFGGDKAENLEISSDRKPSYYEIHLSNLSPEQFLSALETLVAKPKDRTSEMDARVTDTQNSQLTPKK